MTITTNKSHVRGFFWIDLLGLAAIVVIAVKLLLWVDRAIDITIADEARYLFQGVHLGDLGFPSPQWAPLYSTWYYLIDFLLPIQNNVDLYYLNFVLLTVAIPLMLYIYLRRVSVTPAIALPVSLFYLISVSSLSIRPYPTKFAVFSVLICLLAATWIPRRFHYLLLMVTLLILSFIRPEYALAFVLSLAVGIVFSLYRLRQTGWSAWKSIGGQYLLIGGLAIILVMILGNPLAGGRNLTAFKQHVSLTYTLSSDPETNPWVNENVIAEQLFGDFDSIPQAVRNNPPAFLRHIWINMRTYPANMATVVLRPYLPSRILAPSIERAVFYIFLVSSLALLAFCVVLNRGYRSQVPDQISPAPPVSRLPALHDPANASQIRLVATLLAFVTVPVVVSSLLLHPRYHYLQVQGLLLTILAVIFVSNTFKLVRPDWQRTPRRAVSGMLVVAFLSLLLIPNLARGWSFFDEPRVWARTDYKNTVLAIDDLGITTPVRFLTYGVAADYSFDVYLTPGLFRKVPPRLRKGDLDQFLTKQEINMVIWPDKIVEDLAFRDDEQYAGFLADPESFGFQQFAVPGTKGQVRVFVKEELVTRWPNEPIFDTAVSPVEATPAGASGTKETADQLFERGEYTQAVAIYTSLVAADPNDRASRMALGRALAKLGQNEQAIDQYDQVIKQWPEFPWALMQRAALFEQRGDTAAALKDYKAAVNLAPDNADIRFAVAGAYVRAGREKAAIAELEAGLELDPTRQPARDLLQRLQQQH